MIGIKLRQIRMEPQRVVNRMERAEKRAFFRAGGLVRTTARRSIRKTKKKKSLPGHPPKSHSREPNIKTIRFEYLPREYKVIVGPILWQGSKYNRSTGHTLPQVQEEGGPTLIPRRGGRELLARVAARPFMQPALDKVARQVASFFRDSL